MRLSAGGRLGPYEIVAPSGAGGMGEVYKARDTRLDRLVAIKVLAPENGKEISYLALDGTMMATPIAAAARLEPGVPRPLCQSGLTTVSGVAEQYRNSPYGSRFLIRLPVKQDAAPPIPLTVVLNWRDAISE